MWSPSQDFVLSHPPIKHLGPPGEDSPPPYLAPLPLQETPDSTVTPHPPLPSFQGSARGARVPSASVSGPRKPALPLPLAPLCCSSCGHLLNQDWHWEHGLVPAGGGGVRDPLGLVWARPGCTVSHTYWPLNSPFKYLRNLTGTSENNGLFQWWNPAVLLGWGRKGVLGKGRKLRSLFDSGEGGEVATLDGEKEFLVLL